MTSHTSPSKRSGKSRISGGIEGLLKAVRSTHILSILLLVSIGFNITLAAVPSTITTGPQLRQYISQEFAKLQTVQQKQEFLNNLLGVTEEFYQLINEVRQGLNTLAQSNGITVSTSSTSTSSQTNTSTGGSSSSQTYSFSAGSLEDCNKSIVNKLGRQVTTCTVGGGCGQSCGKPGGSCISANPNSYGACILQSEINTTVGALGEMSAEIRFEANPTNPSVIKTMKVKITNGGEGLKYCIANGIINSTNACTPTDPFGGAGGVVTYSATSNGTYTADQADVSAKGYPATDMTVVFLRSDGTKSVVFLHKSGNTISSTMPMCNPNLHGKTFTSQEAFMTASALTLCSVGKSTNISLPQNGPWTWKCEGSTGETATECRAEKGISTTTAVNGTCGTKNAKSFANETEFMASNTTYCANNVSTSYTFNNNTWSWSCTGTNGGTTASCSATKSTSTTQSNLVPGTTNYDQLGNMIVYVGTGYTMGDAYMSPLYTTKLSSGGKTNDGRTACSALNAGNGSNGYKDWKLADYNIVGYLHRLYKDRTSNANVQKNISTIFYNTENPNGCSLTRNSFVLDNFDSHTAWLPYSVPTIGCPSTLDASIQTVPDQSYDRFRGVFLCYSLGRATAPTETTTQVSCDRGGGANVVEEYKCGSDSYTHIKIANRNIENWCKNEQHTDYLPRSSGGYQSFEILVNEGTCTAIKTIQREASQGMCITSPCASAYIDSSTAMRCGNGQWGTRGCTGAGVPK